MELKKGIFGIILLLVFLSSVSAITGSIGNARMILRVDQGDVIERSILVKNVNDVAIDVEMFAEGDLKDYLTLEEEVFHLEPGEEKKAYFSLEVVEAGTTETTVNVKFTPVDGKNGVGLTSTIIVIAKDKGLKDIFFGGDDEDEEGSILTGDVVKEGGSNPAFLFFGLTFLIFVAVLVFLFVMIRKKRDTIKPKKTAKRNE
jgi:hypothetical protein